MKFLAQLAKQMKDILAACMEIVYYMRGGITYTEVMNMSAVERDVAINLINHRLEEAAKMPFPVF